VESKRLKNLRCLGVNFGVMAVLAESELVSYESNGKQDTA
jgi:hypothetical protein